MFEFGMRLTTRKPTVVVAEAGTKLPFDTNMSHTTFYDRSLKHSVIKRFIVELSAQLEEPMRAFENNTYRSFLEHLTFERVEPSTISVPVDQVIERKLDEIIHRVARVESDVGRIPATGLGELGKSFVRGISISTGEVDQNASSVVRTPRFAVGDKVNHAKRGAGHVKEVEGNKITAQFQEGSKRVIDSFITPADDFDDLL